MCFGIFALYNLIFIQEITCIKASYKSEFVLIMTIPDGNRKPRILTIWYLSQLVPLKLTLTQYKQF